MVADVLGGLHALWSLDKEMWKEHDGYKIRITFTKVKGESPKDGADYSPASFQK